MQTNTKSIVDYYDSCEGDYRFFWDLSRSKAMHAGYWDKTTKNLADALQRENQVLAEIAAIQTEDRVLDAGCGIGGSTQFLAREIGCEAVGISLSTKQIDTARRLASQERFVCPPEFFVRDFTQTMFPDASFDVIWGLESICHANDKAAFAREAYRLLKPGGRLIVADGFNTVPQLGLEDQQCMSYWLNGWGVETLDTPELFKQHLELSGFQNVSYRNVTENVMPSSRRLYVISFPAIVMSKIGEWIGKRTKIQTNNIWGAYYQYITLKKGLWEYGIFVAHKNSN